MKRSEYEKREREEEEEQKNNIGKLFYQTIYMTRVSYIRHHHRASKKWRENCRYIRAERSVSRNGFRLLIQKSPVRHSRFHAGWGVSQPLSKYCLENIHTYSEGKRVGMAGLHSGLV